MSAKSRRSEIIGQGMFFFEKRTKKLLIPSAYGVAGASIRKGLLPLFFGKEDFFSTRCAFLGLVKDAFSNKPIHSLARRNRHHHTS
jgi:hypothetical protein